MKIFWKSFQRTVATMRATITNVVRFAAAFVFLPSLALAFTPESGWWYNPTE